MRLEQLSARRAALPPTACAPTPRARRFPPRPDHGVGADVDPRDASRRVRGVQPRCRAGGPARDTAPRSTASSASCGLGDENRAGARAALPLRATRTTTRTHPRHARRCADARKVWSPSPAIDRRFATTLSVGSPSIPPLPGSHVAALILHHPHRAILLNVFPCRTGRRLLADAPPAEPDGPARRGPLRGAADRSSPYRVRRPMPSRCVGSVTATITPSSRSHADHRGPFLGAVRRALREFGHDVSSARTRALGLLRSCCLRCLYSACLSRIAFWRVSFCAGQGRLRRGVLVVHLLQRIPMLCNCVR